MVTLRRVSLPQGVPLAAADRPPLVALPTHHGLSVLVEHVHSKCQSFKQERMNNGVVQRGCLPGGGTKVLDAQTQPPCTA
jgi:hypothetical protein